MADLTLLNREGNRFHWGLDRIKVGETLIVRLNVKTKGRYANGLVVDYVPAAIAMFDRDMRYIAASRRWFADAGLDAAQAIGQSHYALRPHQPEH